VTLKYREACFCLKCWPKLSCSVFQCDASPRALWPHLGRPSLLQGPSAAPALPTAVAGVLAAVLVLLLPLAHGWMGPCVFRGAGWGTHTPHCQPRWQCRQMVHT